MKHYNDEANKALPAIVFGMVGQVRRVDQQRMALLTDLIRADLTDPSKMALQTRLLGQLAETLAEDDMPVLDAGFKVKTLFQAGLERFVLPLISKHMVGAQRQFVSAEESCYRLPELSLLAGSILTFLAATLPPIPTGF
jgi:hypothetical protein